MNEEIIKEKVGEWAGSIVPWFLSSGLKILFIVVAVVVLNKIVSKLIAHPRKNPYSLAVDKKALRKDYHIFIIISFLLIVHYSISLYHYRDRTISSLIEVFPISQQFVGTNSL